MKNRKTVVVAFLLVAAMLLSVGYAAVTDVLDINGTADVNPELAFNDDIYFTSAVANDTGNTASVNQDNNDKASFTANTLHGKGDKATFTFTIANAGDLDVAITPKLSNTEAGNTQPDYFDISSDWNGVAKNLPAAGENGPTSITYTVTVELKQTPASFLSGSFLIELTAEAIDN